jgi:hypothetical protein
MRSGASVKPTNQELRRSLEQLKQPAWFTERLSRMVVEHGRDERRRRRVVMFWSSGLALVTLGSIAYLGVRMELGRWQEESEPVAGKAVARVCSAWDPAELAAVSSRRLLAEASDQQRAALLKEFRQELGSLRNAGRPKGGAVFRFGTGGLLVSAHYDVRARFEGGAARIAVDLEKSWSRWQVTRFMVRYE